MTIFHRLNAEGHEELSPLASYLGNVIGGTAVFLGAAAFFFWVVPLLTSMAGGGPHLRCDCPPEISIDKLAR